jgi:hypothetical protein
VLDAWRSRAEPEIRIDLGRLRRLADGAAETSDDDRSPPALNRDWMDDEEDLEP